MKQLVELKIIKAGILSTIQDGGRFLGLSLGLTQSGVMDYFAYDLAMALIESEIDGPVIEVTGGQFSFVVNGTCEVAITGANSDVYINDTKIQIWQSFQLNKGDKLEIMETHNGLRNYIAIKGVWSNIQLYKNSYSTDLKAGIGGFLGRRLKCDDIILLEGEVTNHKLKLEVNSDMLKINHSHYLNQLYSKHKLIRVCDGPQVDAFSLEMQNKFYDTDYEVSSFSDRMGIRFKGEKLTHMIKADIITDVIAFGAIQIPGDGLPIVMMADRQGTGGYTKIANVLFEDLSILAQAEAGDTVRFIRSDIDNVANNAIEMINFEMKRFEIEDSKQYKITLKRAETPLSANLVFNLIVESII